MFLRIIDVSDVSSRYIVYFIAYRIQKDSKLSSVFARKIDTENFSASLII